MSIRAVRTHQLLLLMLPSRYCTSSLRTVYRNACRSFSISPPSDKGPPNILQPHHFVSHTSPFYWVQPHHGVQHPYGTLRVEKRFASSSIASLLVAEASAFSSPYFDTEKRSNIWRPSLVSHCASQAQRLLSQDTPRTPLCR